jgi:diguanylate cyclase (GGDEF)-like protein
MAALFFVIFIFYPLIFHKTLWEAIAFLGIAAIEFGIFLYANRRQRNAYPGKNCMFAVYCIFFFSILFFGLYREIFTASIIPVINFYMFLLFTQVLFIFDPILNLSLNVIVLIFFACFSLQYGYMDVFMQNIGSGLVAGTIGMVFSWYASYYMIREMLTAKKLEEERAHFKEQSIKDELTGLSNRRDFLNSVNFYTSVCQQVHQTVCVMMMDVDHFKKYNDFYGHAHGDFVLKMIGEVLKKLIQEHMVFAARVGGEEFIILWTENRLSEAERLALKLRQMINDMNIPHEQSDSASHITASYGLYFLRGGSKDTADELYQKADRALYEAKRHGRNRVVLLDSDDQTTFRSVAE